MKKIIALLLAMVMLLSLVACGTTEPAPATDAAPQAPVEEATNFPTDAEVKGEWYGNEDGTPITLTVCGQSIFLNSVSFLHLEQS